MEFTNIQNNISLLWQRVFDEDKEVTSLFFNNIYKFCENPYIEENGEVLSSLFLIPCEIENYKGLYVYCAMTKETHRGKGLMEKLLKEADQVKSQNNLDFLILVPASESLFNYYSKFGYEKFGYNFKIEKAEEYTEANEKYSTVRHFDGTELKFSDEVIDYWAEATKIYGGCVIKANGEYCLLGDEVLDAKEGSKETGVAMIKTEIQELKNTQAFIGITLE